MDRKDDNLINDFGISDGEIDALMEELEHFSPEEAESFFAETDQGSFRSVWEAGKRSLQSLSALRDRL